MAAGSHDNSMPTLASLRRKGKRSVAPPMLPGLFGSDEPPVASAVEVFDPADAVMEEPPVVERAPAPVVPARRELPEPPPLPRVLTVGELVRRVRGLVETQFASITVEGEISNWRPAGSGHCYFTLKDGQAQLAIVMFRREAMRVTFAPKDGDAVRITGKVSVYEGRGQVQLVAERMEQVGLGALLEAVRLLKERLRREGLFERKRPLPQFPKCIGVVTSLQGAALRDILKVCRRRHAGVNLLVYPAAVQGPNCAREVAAGVRWFSRHPERADVVLVARGGGSWEDLHGFDAEEVVRAIAECSLPVITGIGHAPDSVIADAAADQCAPTPSAAAELLTDAQHRVEERVERLASRLERAGRYEILRARQRFARLSAEGILRGAREGLQRRAQRLDELEFRAENATTRSLRGGHAAVDRLEARLRRMHPALTLAEDRRKFSELQARLERTRRGLVETREARVERAELRLEALSPLKVLDRGYALVYTGEGALVRSAGQLAAGQEMVARFGDGRVRARVESSK